MQKLFMGTLYWSKNYNLSTIEDQGGDRARKLIFLKKLSNDSILLCHCTHLAVAHVLLTVIADYF